MTDQRKKTDDPVQAVEVGTTSSSLIARWQGNDEEAWQRLVHLYYPLVYYWCRRWGSSAEMARDVVQEVFLALAKDLTRFRSEGGKNSFRGWLWGVTRNQWRYYLRKGKNQPLASGGTGAQQRFLEIPETTTTHQDEPGGSSEQTGVIHRAIELLRREFEERTWQAFWRTTVDGRTAQDVAADLNITRNAVYLAKSRVLRRLREELDGLVDL